MKFSHVAFAVLAMVGVTAFLDQVEKPTTEPLPAGVEVTEADTAPNGIPGAKADWPDLPYERPLLGTHALDDIPTFHPLTNDFDEAMASMRKSGIEKIEKRLGGSCYDVRPDRGESPELEPVDIQQALRLRLPWT